MSDLRKLKLPLLLAVLICLMLIGSDFASAQKIKAANPPLVSAVSKPAGSEIQYQLLLQNTDTISHRYQLTTSLLPTNYRAAFLLDKQAISQLDISPSGSQTLQLDIQLPQMVSAGINLFKVVLNRDDGQTFTLPLACTINKDYALSITSHPQDLTVLSGQSARFDITVANTGNNLLEQIQLQFELPHKWLIKQVIPQKLALKPGEEGSFQVHLVLPNSQAAGNEKIKIIANADHARSAQAEVPIQVQKNPSYLIGAGSLVLLAGLGTIYYFRKNGRR